MKPLPPLTQERVLDSVAKPARRRRIDAVLISSDDGFLIELGPLLGDDYRTHTVDSPAALASLSLNASWLAIIDGAAISDADAAVARTRQAHPQAPIVVVAQDLTPWKGLINRGTIAAVERDELSSPRFREILSIAAARASSAPPVDATATAATRLISATGTTGALRVEAPGAAPPPAGIMSRQFLPWSLGALAAVGALVAAGWWLYRPSAHRQPTGGTAAPVAASTASMRSVGSPAGAASRSQTILELLSAARVQFHDQKLPLPRVDGEPRGDSALELYAQVLSQDPNNAEALDGIARLWAIGKSRIQADLASGKFDDASRLITLFKAAGLGDEQLQPITAGMTAARPKWLTSRALQSIAAGDLATSSQLIDQLAALGADSGTVNELRRALDAKRLEQQLSGLSAQVQTAVAAGALLAPASDNAMDHLNAMRTLARAHPITLAAQREVRAALLAHGQQAIRQQQFDQATRYLGAAAEIGGSTDLADLKRQLQDEMQRATESAAAAAAAKASAASAAAQASAAAASSAAPAAPSIIMASPVRPLAVSYPEQVHGVEGRVLVEFTLHPNGSASDVVVVDAKPKNLFDRTAMDAVRRGRYDARGLVAGQSARARISLHFKPQ